MGILKIAEKYLINKKEKPFSFITYSKKMVLSKANPCPAMLK